MSAPGTILLIDDDELARAATQRMLEHLGFEVLAFEEGCRAMECFARDTARYSCAVLDFGMPHMNGEQCFRKLRALRPDLPVMITSGADEGEILAQLANETATACLQKPYRREALAVRLKELLPDARSA